MEKWKCPACKRTDRLSVCIRTYMELDQDFDKGEYSTGEPDKINGDHEWGNDSLMHCRACGHAGLAETFAFETDSKSAMIHVVTVRHKHGTDAYAGVTEEDALAAVFQYVLENWHEMPEQLEEPDKDADNDNRKKAIQVYFETMADQEWYEVGSTELVGEMLNVPNRWVVVSDADMWVSDEVFTSKEHARDHLNTLKKLDNAIYRSLTIAGIRL